MEKFFKNKECLITFTENNAGEQMFLSAFDLPKDDKFIYIDLIEVKKYARGEGLARETLLKFIDIKRKEGFKYFFLLASYDPDYYDNPDYENGLKGLVDFYKSVGFKSIVNEFCNFDKIDMKLYKE